MKRNLMVLSLCLGLAAIALPSFAGEAVDDETAIKAAALDYVMGWYTGDAERMERALHPDLAKRIVRVDPEGKWDRVDGMSALTLVQYTRKGYGKKVPVEERQGDVTPACTVPLSLMKMIVVAASTSGSMDRSSRPISLSRASTIAS